MKKILFFIGLAIGSIHMMQSQQISKNALGVRLGDNDGFGAEVSYQRALGDAKRLELDLGWRDIGPGTAIKVAGLYQWVFRLDKGLNWYVGPGGGVGVVDYDNDNDSSSGSDSFFFLGGTVGIEYNFDIPILISLDFRPEVGFGDFKDDLDLDFGVGIRYQF